MPTLSEYKKLDLDELKQGVIDEIRKADDLMNRLQFKSISGSAHQYKRESTNPAAAFHVVGDTWQDTEYTVTNKTASLTILGLQSPLDLFAKATLSNNNDQKATLLKRMAKGLSEKLKNTIITGEPEAVTSEFEGLDSLVRSETRMMAMDDGNVDGPGTVETELTMDRLDAMIDLVEDGKPDILIMNKKLRRKLSSLSRSAGSGVLPTVLNEFGLQVSFYDGIPIAINEYITSAEQYNDANTWPTSTASTIFGVKLGEENDGYTILHNGEVLSPEIQDLGIKENANEELFRMVLYIQAVTWSTKMVAALGGIDSSA